jgi:hypothetical protein
VAVAVVAHQQLAQQPQGVVMVTIVALEIMELLILAVAQAVVEVVSRAAQAVLAW